MSPAGDEETVVDHFRTQVERTPQAIAVADGDEPMDLPRALRPGRRHRGPAG